MPVFIKPPLRIWMGRHTQSEENKAWGEAWRGNLGPIRKIRTHQGGEIHLTSSGRAQAAKIGLWLDHWRAKRRKLRFLHYRSASLRVHEMVDIIMPDTVWCVDDFLRERDTGILGTMLPAERQIYEENLSERFTFAELYRLRPGEERGNPTGESFADVEARLKRGFIAGIKAACGGKNMFLLGHGGTTWVLRALLEDMQPEVFLRIYQEKRLKIKNGSILEYTSINPLTGQHTGIINWMRMCTPWENQEFSRWTFLKKTRETLFCE